MEKKRKLIEAEIVEGEKPKSKKKKKEPKNVNEESQIEDTPVKEKSKANKISANENINEIQTNFSKSDSKKIKKKKIPVEHETTNVKNRLVQETTEPDKASEDIGVNEVETNNNSTSEEKKKKVKDHTGNVEHETEKSIEIDSANINEPTIDGDGINTPTTKRPPRKSGETKKQYKRRMRALREAGLLIDPPVLEGVKKEKRNRKTRKEKRVAIQKKNEELEKFRSIVQINYLNTWKKEPSKWKFNKNVQGKLIKHMFDAARIPQDVFQILIDYMATSQSTKMHADVNKKCSQVVEAMEKWSSADEEEKKKLTEPDQDVYERARQILQSLA